MTAGLLARRAWTRRPVRRAAALLPRPRRWVVIADPRTVQRFPDLGVIPARGIRQLDWQGGLRRL